MGANNTSVDAQADAFFDLVRKYIDARDEKLIRRCLEHWHPPHPAHDNDIAELRGVVKIQDETIAALNKRLRILEQRLSLLESR